MIPSEEVRFHPHSFADRSGRLFFWRDRLFRAIPPDHAAFYSALLTRPELQELIRRRLLVDTLPTTHKLAGYELVVEHPVIPFPTYPMEWPAPMLRDAALFVLDFALELVALGLELKDAHPWNVLFEGTVPTYVDLGSIVPRTVQNWRAEDEFRHFFLNPLVLIGCGEPRIARALLPEHEGVTDRDVARYTPRRAGLRRLRSKSRAGRHDLRRRLTFLRREIEALPIASSNLRSAADKGEEIITMVSRRIEPQSLLLVEPEDVPAWLQSRRTAKKVVVFAATESSAAQLYSCARQRARDALPLLMDIFDPTPERGIAGHWQVAAVDRLRCDMVVASEAARRRASRHLIRPESFATGLAAFARRAVAVELPNNSESSAPMSVALGRHFQLVEELEAAGRRVLLAHAPIDGRRR